jgi:hypothetical protein
MTGGIRMNGIPHLLSLHRSVECMHIELINILTRFYVATYFMVDDSLCLSKLPRPTDNSPLLTICTCSHHLKRRAFIPASESCVHIHLPS